jgi:hypothetical protein
MTDLLRVCRERPALSSATASSEITLPRRQVIRTILRHSEIPGRAGQSAEFPQKLRQFQVVAQRDLEPLSHVLYLIEETLLEVEVRVERLRWAPG